MELKKSKQANLQRKRVIFFEIGFIISLALALIAFEWPSEAPRTDKFKASSQQEVEQEAIPVTRQEIKEEPPPPPPKTTEIINIVDDDVKIEDELILEETEADQDTRVSIDAFAQEEEEESEEIFISVEEMPTFKGKGIEGFRNYIQTNLLYPEIARENGIEGTIYIRFVINEKGMAERISILRGVDPSLEKAVVEAIQKSPKWEPGKQRGKAVKVSFTMPIMFTLD